MKSKTYLSIFVVLVLAASPAVGLAQHRGVLVGPGHAGFGHGPAGGRHGQFRGGPPASPIPARIVGVPFVPNFVPNFPTVIVPSSVLLPGQTVLPFPGQVIAPFPAQTSIPAPLITPQGPIVTPPSSIIYPANPIQPNPPFVPSAGSVFQVVTPVFQVVGTPRAEVIREFGQPSVTVITSTNETLYYPGGASVVIRNGEVAGPK